MSTVLPSMAISISPDSAKDSLSSFPNELIDKFVELWCAKFDSLVGFQCLLALQHIRINPTVVAPEAFVT
jgi:hypothetical protein